MDFHEQITLVGRSEGTASSAIVSEVAGQVAAIVAPEGNPIKKGETLVEIDSDRLRLDLMAKEGEFVEAREQHDLAKKHLARSEDLFQRKLISDISFDSAKSWINISEGRLKRLTAERDRMAKDVDDCKVKAPYSGFTSRRLINVGEWVNRGTPVYEMADISRLRVVVDLPERYYGRLTIGSPASVVGSADTLTPLSGVVTGVSRSANAETHTYPVIIQVDNQDSKLGGGALVRATLSFDQLFNSTAVSKDAIIKQGSQMIVYTIQEGNAAPVPVTVSATVGDLVAVSGPGIVPGITVIVRGNERVFPGAPVRTADSPPPGQITTPDTTNQTGN
jgi:RND family efflux transporter MFP subunit